MRVFYLAIFTMLASCQYSQANDICHIYSNTNLANSVKKVYEIDLRQEQCMKEDNYTNISMRECSSHAAKKWLNELDKVYFYFQEVLTNNKNQELLQQLNLSQQSWQHFHDNQQAFAREIYANTSGTIWPTINISVYQERIKQRVIDLAGLCELYIDEIN